MAKPSRRVLDHSLVRSHRSVIRSLRTARFARALSCAHSFVRSLAHSLTLSRAHAKEIHVYELNASLSYSFNPLWIRAKVQCSNLRVNKNGAVSAFLHPIKNSYFLVDDEIIVFYSKAEE